MKKVIIKDLSGKITHGAEDLDPSAWIAECKEKNLWGKKAGTYKASELSDDELITAITFINTDENGNLLEDALVTIPDQYTIEVVDISAEIADKKAKDLAKAQAKKDRIAALKGIAWPSVDTVAELKVIVKLLVDETLKDE